MKIKVRSPPCLGILTVQEECLIGSLPRLVCYSQNVASQNKQALILDQQRVVLTCPWLGHRRDLAIQTIHEAKENIARSHDRPDRLRTRRVVPVRLRLRKLRHHLVALATWLWDYLVSHLASFVAGWRSVKMAVDRSSCGHNSVIVFIPLMQVNRNSVATFHWYNSQW